MNATELRPAETARPLVVVLCTVPFLGEAVGSVLGFAEVRSFAGRGGDLAGLLRWLRPDALVVDNEEDAREATPLARRLDVPLLHISLRDPGLRLFHGGAWKQICHGEGPTPQLVRNVLAGALFTRVSDPT